MASSIIDPEYYKDHPSGIECIDVAQHYNYNLGNVIKYLWRCGKKTNNSKLQDLQKARWYLECEITRLENEK